MSRLFIVVLTAVVWMLSCASFMQAADEKVVAVTFDKLQPVLQKRCGSCHGRNEPRSGLDLTNLTGLKAGSESGPVVVSGKPELSLLYLTAAHLDGPKMPPGKERIPSSELQLFHDWIAGGLQERGGAVPSTAMNSAVPASLPALVAVTPLTRPTATTALAVDPRGKLIAVSGIQQVVLLDAKTHQPTTAFPFPEGEVFALKFSQDGEWLVAGGGLGAASGKVVIFEVATGKRILETPEERDSVLSIDITPDRQTLAWGGPWRTVKVLNVSSQKITATLSGPTDWVLSVCLSPDGRLVAGSDRFGGVRVWNIATGKEFWNLRGHTGAVPKVVWSPTSDQLLSVGEDGTARMWDLHTGEITSLCELKLGGLWAADWHASNVIAIGGRHRKGALLSSKGQTLFELPITDETTEIAFTADGSQVLLADAGGRITPFAVASGKPIEPFSLPLAAAATLARVEVPWPPRTRPVRNVPPQSKSTASPEDELLQAVLEAEEAVKTTEASLVKLRETAGRLRKILAERDPRKP